MATGFETFNRRVRYALKETKEQNYKEKKKNIIFIICITMIYLLVMATLVFSAPDYSDEQIADAIFLAENSKRFPYGIKSIDTKGDEAYARKICLNTIRNNRRRYKDYGHKQYATYLEFLSSRYAPTKNCENDPNGLNKNWLKNVLYFLNKGGEGGNKKREYGIDE